MEKELIEVMTSQEIYLEQLFKLLQVQREMIMRKDTFGLESLIDKLNECSKIIAQKEVLRRRLLGENSLVGIVNSSNNVELKSLHEKIKHTVNKAMMQKEMNTDLLKHELIFTNKMLNVINPDREIKTYNSYGGLRK